MSLVVARNGHGAMHANLSPLSGEERKSDFAIARSVDDPLRTFSSGHLCKICTSPRMLAALRLNIQYSLQNQGLRIGLRGRNIQRNSDDKDRQKISAITRVCNGCRVRGGNTSFRTNSAT